jgi:hypothetical protein
MRFTPQERLVSEPCYNSADLVSSMIRVTEAAGQRAGNYHYKPFRTSLAFTDSARRSHAASRTLKASHHGMAGRQTQYRDSDMTQ